MSTTTEPMVLLRAGPGWLMTDQPIGDGPVICYIEDFPDMLLNEGDRLRVTGVGGMAFEAIAQFRRRPLRRERRKR